MKQSVLQLLILVIVLLIVVHRWSILAGNVWTNAGQVALNQAQITSSDTQHLQLVTRAEVRFRKALDYYPENRFSRWGLGLTLSIRGCEDDALATWQTIRDVVEEFVQRGDALQAAQKYAIALTWYLRASALAPATVEPWYRMGQVYEQIQIPEEALIAYEQALGLDPTDVEVHYAIGNLLLNKLSRHEQALDTFQAAVALDPIPVRAYVGMGTALDYLHHDNEALRAFHKAAELSYQVHGNTSENQWERVWPHYVLGDFYLHQGRLDEATRSFEQALAQDPNRNWAGWPLWGLGRVALRRMRYDEAMDYFSEAYQTATVTSNSYLRSQVYLGLGDTLIRQGDVTQGIDYLQKAHFTDPENKGLHRYLADTLREAGMYGDAIEEYERYLQKWPNDQAVIQALEESRQVTDSR